MECIRAERLSKVYTRFEKEEGLKGSIKSLFVRKTIEKRAVNELDLSVREGEFVGLIGPNGAGKTTLVKMATGIIAKTSGELRVLGFEPNALKDEFKRGYAVVMGQKSQLFFELTAADSFRLFQRLYDIPEPAYKKTLAYFTELFGVGELLNVMVRTLSLGERMKMELIAALLHNPKLLFLDEPTIGLDAVAQRQIRDFLREVNRERGTTILLTSHYMEDIRALCSRGVVINHGRKVYDGTLTSLFERYQTKKKLTVRFARTTDYKPRENAEVLERDGYHVSFLLAKDEAQTALKEILDTCEVTDISVEEEDIGAVVERIYHAGEEVGA